MQIKRFIFLILLLFFTLPMLSSSYAEDFVVGSYNIRNFDYDERSDTPTDKRQLKKLMQGIAPDLFAIQEIVNGKAFSQFIQRHFKHYTPVLTKCGGSADQKLGLIYNHKKLEMISFWEDPRLSTKPNTTINDNISTCPRGLRPAAIGHFKMRKSNLEFIAIALHLKAGGRQSSANIRSVQYQQITDIIEEIRTDKNIDNFIVMGDFNTTGYIGKDHNYETFMQFLKRSDLQDTSENVGCTSFWWGGKQDGRYYPTILDHLLISTSLLNHFKKQQARTHAHCQQTACLPTPLGDLGVSFDKVSDHCPISLKMSSITP